MSDCPHPCHFSLLARKFGKRDSNWLLNIRLRPEFFWACVRQRAAEALNAMTTAETLCALDNFIRERSILQHPFYRAWQRGELTSDQLATYSRVYYPHVAAF